MLMVLKYGKGRIFHTTLGHDVAALSDVGFITTFQRGTEWAATGKATQKVPAGFPTARTLSVFAWTSQRWIRLSAKVRMTVSSGSGKVKVSATPQFRIRGHLRGPIRRRQRYSSRISRVRPGRTYIYTTLPLQALISGLRSMPFTFRVEEGVRRYIACSRYRSSPWSNRQIPAPTARHSLDVSPDPRCRRYLRRRGAARLGTDRTTVSTGRRRHNSRH